MTTIGEPDRLTMQSARARAWFNTLFQDAKDRAATWEPRPLDIPVPKRTMKPPVLESDGVSEWLEQAMNCPTCYGVPTTLCPDCGVRAPGY